MGKIGGLASTARTTVFTVCTNKGQNLLIYLWWEVLMVSQDQTQIIFKLGGFPEGAEAPAEPTCTPTLALQDQSWVWRWGCCNPKEVSREEELITGLL